MYRLADSHCPHSGAVERKDGCGMRKASAGTDFERTRDAFAHLDRVFLMNNPVVLPRGEMGLGPAW